MEKENIYCKKIRIFPKGKQKEYFRKCFGTTRYFYNKAVEYVNNKCKETLDRIKRLKVSGCIKHIKGIQCKRDVFRGSKYGAFCKKHSKLKNPIDWGYKLSLSFLRKKLMKSNKNLNETEMWQKDIPYDTRQLALKSFISSIKSAISLKKIGNNKGFTMKFKSSKNKFQFFNIDHRGIELVQRNGNTSIRLFPTLMKKLKINKFIDIKKHDQKRTQNVSIDSDCTISIGQFKEWYNYSNI